MSLSACTALVNQADPWRARCLRGAGGASAILAPLYAFNIEVSRAPWVTSEPLIAEMRLQWWLDVVADMSAGRAPRAHELTDCLRVAPDALPELQAMAQARRWDIYRDPFADEAALITYLEETYCGLIWVGARSLGADRNWRAAVYDYAFGGAVAAWLTAAPELEARGRVPLLDGTANGVSALARQGVDRQKRGRKALRGFPKPAAAALWPAVQGPAVLRRAMAQPGLVAADGLALAPVRQDLLLLRARLSA
jgi:phytoene synthase